MFNKKKKKDKDQNSKVIKKIMGRPTIDLDVELLTNLCQIQCTKDEILNCLEMSDSTLTRRIKEKTGLTFEEFREQNSGKGKASLRRIQYMEAMKGNTQMLKFLGQNYLDQSEKTRAETKNDNVNKNFDLSHLSETELTERLKELNDILSE